MNGFDERNERLRPRFFPRVNDFEELNDVQFRAQYRLTKEAVLMLLGMIEHGLQAHNMNHRVPPMNQLLVTLLFYATGTFFWMIGKSLGISKTTAWRIVHRVSRLIAALSPEVIRFPATEEEKLQAQAELFAISAFPRVIACVDGRQVRVKSFGGDNAELFRNRHGEFSINVQLMCNARLEFVNIVSRWPGSTHDSTIFRNSCIYRSFEQGTFGDSLIVGDSGYPERPYLMTSLRVPETPAEHLYNEAQIRTRNPVERAFGVWGARFPVIGGIGSRFHKVEHALTVIVATAVCHNIALFTDPLNRIDVNIHQYRAIHNNIQLGPGDTFRRRLITGYFQQLI